MPLLDPVSSIGQVLHLDNDTIFHRVVDGTAYPAVMFVSGENDGRVNPADSRRMMARLQAATNSGWPVLLRTSVSAGHGVDTALNDRSYAVAPQGAFAAVFSIYFFQIFALRAKIWKNQSLSTRTITAGEPG